jgi:hypothetical protein
MKTFILILLTFTLFSCDNVVKNGAVFEVTGQLQGKEYGLVQDVRFQAEIYYVLVDGNDSKTHSKTVEGLATINGSTINAILTIDIRSDESAEIKVMRVGKITAEVTNGVFIDILQGSNGRTTKFDDYSYQTNINLSYIKTVEKNRLLHDFERCYERLNIQMSAESAYHRCRQLVYGY